MNAIYVIVAALSALLIAPEAPTSLRGWSATSSRKPGGKLW